MGKPDWASRQFLLFGIGIADGARIGCLFL
jgi:hypothetical protein